MRCMLLALQELDVIFCSQRGATLWFGDRRKVEKIRELWPLLWYCLTIESAVFVVLVVLTVAFVSASCITSYQQNHSGKYDDSDVIVERL